LTKELYIQKSRGFKVFGNSVSLNEKQVDYPLVPEPLFVAKWAIEFGMSKKTFNYDFLEPNYLKDFIVKEKNK
jgi:hypothetical protein